jgi:cytochrome c peroxidase
LRLASSVLLLVAVNVNAQGVHQVGGQDVRAGYDSASFRTDTEAILMQPGARLPLADMARQPPLGLPDLQSRFTAAEVDLGRRLFFDRRLSVNATLSCAMCHIPEQGFTQNELATPVGNEGRGVRRNAPALYNVVYVQQLFLDGRETSLPAQIWAPLLAANEMANNSRAEVIQRLSRIEDYAAGFREIYADGLTEITLGQALAAYQSVLLSAASPFDHWYFGGVDVLSATARRGFEVFLAQGCSGCHTVAQSRSAYSSHRVCS